MANGTFISAVKYYGEMEGSMYSSDIRLVNLDTDGNLLWSFDYTGEFDRDIQANHLSIAPDQNFLIVGRQEDAESSQNFEGWAMKIGTDDIVISNPDGPDGPDVPISDNYALSFDGINDYVSFGPNVLSVDFLCGPLIIATVGLCSLAIHMMIMTGIMLLLFKIIV